MSARTLVTVFAVLLSATAAHADFYIDDSSVVTRSTRYDVLGDSGVVQRSFDCMDVYGDGVVRSWYLRERNEADFRRSKHFCRDMAADGTLATGYVGQTHFDHTGGYTEGDSSIPLDRLPVGVRTKWKLDGAFTAYDKLIDVNLIHSDAETVIDGDDGWSGAGYALGRAGSTTTLECPAYYVMTGLRILEKTTGTGGANQSEIVGVRIVCARLRES